MARSSILFLFVFISLIMTNSIVYVDAWGWDTHYEVVEQAVNLLPEEWRDLLKNNLDTSKDGASYPDYIKSSDPTEGPRHYDDSDIVHQDINVSSSSSDYALGVISWAVQNATYKLVDLLGGEDENEIIHQFGVLSHYAADATQPLHATSNYDGRDTGNTGIHSRFESDLVERYWDDIFIEFTFGNLEIIDPYNLTKSSIASGFALVDTILEADDIAQENANSKSSDLYYEYLFNQTKEIVQSRIRLSIQNIANLWYTALVWANIITPTEISSNSISSTTQSLPTTTSTSATTPFLFIFGLPSLLIFIKKRQIR